MNNDSSEGDRLLGNENDGASSYLRSESFEERHKIKYNRFPSQEIHVSDNEEQIKAKLRWFFKNPYEKYIERGRKPWKFVLQLVKIVVITVQATLFATDEFSVVNFNKDNIETFQHLYLWDYPTFSNNKVHNIYRKKEVYEHIFHSWKQYYNYEKIMIGSYEVKKRNETFAKMEFCKHFDSKMPLSKETDACYNLVPPLLRNGTEIPLDEFVAINRLPTDFEWLTKMTVEFSFQVSYTMLHSKNSPDCYQFNIQILFDNEDLDGIMKGSLNSEVDFRFCRTQNDKGLHIKEHIVSKILSTAFDTSILCICTLSLSLCLRSFKRNSRLSIATSRFFREYRHEPFTLHDTMNFFSFWLILIALSDIFTISGSIIKIILDWMEYPELYASCSLCFGLAVLFSWIGVLRYLGFLKGYNTLLITIKTAFPSMIRFVLCVFFIYMGFVVCGWIVFGPYHEKFRNLYVTSECLFALINGDDMYATFSGIDDSDALVWYFSKVYLYVFISLFIFVVLSLFIGIMADTYERIKDYGHPPKSRLELFMEGKEHDEGEQQQHRHGPKFCAHHYDEEYNNITHDDNSEGEENDPLLTSGDQSYDQSADHHQQDSDLEEHVKHNRKHTVSFEI